LTRQAYVKAKVKSFTYDDDNVEEDVKEEVGKATDLNSNTHLERCSSLETLKYITHWLGNTQK